MAHPQFSAALSVVVNALFLGIGFYIYGALTRQIQARSAEVVADPTAETARGFGWLDALVAGLLIFWFFLNFEAASAHRIVGMRTSDLVANALFSLALPLGLALFLRARGLSLERLGGFSKLTFGRALSTGAVLMLAAYPLVFLADTLSQRVLGVSDEKQGIVELFNASDSLGQRVLIIILAVAIAPMAEEFLFRFFLYGVIKRYAGRLVALAANALLFGAVHAHLPSFAPLFVLGGCFTLAFPELFPQ